MDEDESDDSSDRYMEDTNTDTFLQTTNEQNAPSGRTLAEIFSNAIAATRPEIPLCITRNPQETNEPNKSPAWQVAQSKKRSSSNSDFTLHSETATNSIVTTPGLATSSDQIIVPGPSNFSACKKIIVFFIF